MPYFTRQSTSGVSTAALTTEHYSFNGTQFASSNSSILSSTNNAIFSAKRAGSNSSIPELIRIYGIGAFTLTKKKKFVGYEFRNVVRRIWYRDRNGNHRFKDVTKTKRFPKFIMFTSARFNKPAIDSQKTSAFYLKPNPLVYSQATNVATPKPMTIVKEQYTNTLGGYVSQRAIFRTSGPGLFQSPIYPYLSVQVGNPNFNWIETWGGDAGLAQDALRRLYSKVASDIPDYLTAAAESRELIRTVKSICFTAIKLVKDLKRLDMKRLKGRLKTSPQDISSLWLTWIYGVAPVISDITDTIDVVKRSDRTWRSFSTAVFRETVTPSTDYDVNFIGKAQAITKHIERYGAIIEGRITIDSVYRDQVNWQGVISTAYELVPFSFMIDWIANIGEYLGSSQIFEDKVYSAWRTSIKLESASQVGYFGLNPDYPFNRTYSAPFSIYQNNCYVSRQVIPTLPAMPDIKVKKPATDVLSLSRAINALAILVATTDGLKRPPGLR
jgi:hypothetical protein